MVSLGSCFTTSQILQNKQQLASASSQPPYILLIDPGPALTAPNLDSQLGFAWESPRPAQIVL